FRLSRYQAAPTRDPRGGRVSRRESRAHIEISRERRDRSERSLSDIRDNQYARTGTHATRRPSSQVAGASGGCASDQSSGCADADIASSNAPTAHAPASVSPETKYGWCLDSELQ